MKLSDSINGGKIQLSKSKSMPWRLNDLILAADRSFNTAYDGRLWFDSDGNARDSLKFYRYSRNKGDLEHRKR